MKKTLTTRTLCMTLSIVFSAVLLLLSNGVEAKQQVVPVEGVGYNVNASMADNLKSLVGKKVYVTIDSGKVISGIVKEIGNHLLHLEKLDGKDYFDALIRLEEIIAIDTRFRNFKR
ncbi:MAG: hypothetical protein KAJ60_08075 [Desulfobulbaceae bacterium]|nr:hypothetical protein [Desulfobulbaceae bacterium]